MQLTQLFLSYLASEVASGVTSPKTFEYYRHYLERWQTRLRSFDPPVVSHEDLKPFHLVTGNERRAEVQVVQRVFNWAVELGYCEYNPFKRVKLPPIGERERVLTRDEMAAVMRELPRNARLAIAFMRHTIARPGEVRGLRWSDYDESRGLLKLAQFKAKKRRKVKLQARYIPVDDWLRRMLEKMRRRRMPSPTDFILFNQRGQPFSSGCLTLAFRRATERLGLRRAGEESPVPYSVRHTAATCATENGIRDRQLADIMGHTSTRTTARYQHLDTAQMGEVIRQATAPRRRRAVGDGVAAGSQLRVFSPNPEAN